MATDLRVERLSTTPVKGLSLHHPQTISLTREGVPGDRRFFLVDESGALQSCTRNPALHGLRAVHDPERDVLEVRRGERLLHQGPAQAAGPVDVDLWGLRTVPSDTVEDPAWGELFSDLLGTPVRLLRARAAAYDVQPVTLLGRPSVSRLSAETGGTAVDARRFRMLVEFSGGTPHVEDSWQDSLIRIGSAVLRGGGPVHRCAATTRDPDSGTVDLQTLRLITGYRGRQDSVFGPGANFGVYAGVVEPGSASVGDAVELEANEARAVMRTATAAG